MKLNQKGNAGVFAIFIMIVAIVVIVLMPANYSETPSIAGGCPIGEKPKINEELVGLPAVPFVDEPNEIIESIDTTKKDKTFVLIRRNVPTPKASEVQGRNFFAEFNQISAGNVNLSGGPTNPHTVNLGEFPQKPGYFAFYPTWEASVASGDRAYFAQQKIIFFVNMNPKSMFETPNGPVYTVDIYVQKELFDPNRDYEGELFACSPQQLATMQKPVTTESGGVNPVPMMASISGTEREATASQGFYIPGQTNSEDKTQLQLQYFLIHGQPLATWSTHCKPAVYMYPPKKQLVNVKVFPAGQLIYVDPPYDQKSGWNVMADRSGKLEVVRGNDKIYDYLYFESRIHDEVIKKPTYGWVVQSASQSPSPEGEGQGEGYVWFNPLEQKFNDLLPKLGLNATQTKDFIEYWKKALPYSPYYFVGVIDQENVDQIERLEITPKPDSVNRVRIYFERLAEPKVVEAPLLENKKFELSSTEFKVVEWGGMVKNDPNHPFTCSQ